MAERKKTFIPSKEVMRRISNWEGKAMVQSTIDPLSRKKVNKNNSFESEAAAFYRQLPAGLREAIVGNQELADNLFSYSYNVGAGNFRKRVVPALVNYYNGYGTAQDVADSMWASGDKKLKGLKNRRAYEKNAVINALPKKFVQDYTEIPDALQVITPYPVQVDNTYVAPQMVPNEGSYVEAHPLTQEEIRKEQISTTLDNINRFNNLMQSISIQNNPVPQYRPANAPYTVNSNAEGGFLQPKDAWDTLSMAEKAEIIRVGVRNGLTNIQDIRNKYNEFAEGGSKEEGEGITDKQYLNTMEKVAEENYKNWGYNSSDEALVHALNDNTYDYRGYYNKYPQSRANAGTHWTDEFKTVYHPTFSNESIYSGKKSQYNPNGRAGGFWLGENLFIPAPWQLFSNYAEGGKIHIKPSHKGRLTELKERTGKTEAELYNDGNPAHKKMVVFARSARKWKHSEGGPLVDMVINSYAPGGTITYGKPFYSYDEKGQRVDGTLNYNGFLSNIDIIPDSQKTPVQRMEDERYRQRTQRDYAEQKSREYTERQIAKSQKEWDNSLEKALLDYGQVAATGIGMGADIVSGLPIYSSLKGASVLSGAETPMDYIEGGLWISPIVGETINGTYQAAKPAVENFLINHPALYQYPRYAIGKFKYGFDAELPTLYRKVKTLPKVENGKVQISNPDNRFAYENGYGEESPTITNFTTDAPVRSHSAGNWDRGLTLAFPGRTLLGKHVISTRPSDTFTFGDNISVPVKDVTAFSGRPKEIASMDNAGIRTITSPDAEMFLGIDSRDLGRRISEARETIQKINAAKAAGNRMVLLKPKMPIENFSNYSRAIEDLTRETFKSPTARDYQFMDYVFRPKYDSQIMPVINDITFDIIDKYPLMGEWVGNTERLRYLDDPSRWQNLMYDPLTTAESDFRGAMNIGLKPEYKK